MRGIALPVLVPIENPINDLMWLHEEVYVLSWVDIPQEVLVNGHQQLHIPMMIHSGPDGAQFLVDFIEVTQVLKQLLD